MLALIIKMKNTNENRESKQDEWRPETEKQIHFSEPLEKYKS